MMWSLLLALLCTLALASASTVHYAHTHSSPAAAWIPDTSAPTRVPSTAPHSFLWLFPTTDDAWLHSQFLASSTPSSPHYLRHLSWEAVQAATGPSAADKAVVSAWLAEVGVAAGGVRDYGWALSVETTVGVVERLFNTTVQRLRHRHTNSSANVAVSGAYVPSHLTDKLSSLLGVYNYPTPIRGQLTIHRTPLASPDPSTLAPPSPQPNKPRFHTLQTQETEAQCASNYAGSYYFAIAPDALATAYNYTVRYTDTVRQATRAGVVGGFSGRTSGGTSYHEAFSTLDLSRFRTNGGFSTAFVATLFNSNNANNLAANTAAGVGPTAEASLDIQALFQTSPTSNNSFIAVTGTQTLLDSLLAIAAITNGSRPQVISYSYGFGYSDYDYMTNSGYGMATERALLQLAALGVTVVVSSGDDGTQSGYNRQCSTSPNTLYSGTLIAPVQYASSPMLPQYPASSAYVLSVSETSFLGVPAKSGTGYGNYFSPSVTSPPRCNNCPSGQSVAYFCQSQLSTENPVSTSNAHSVDATTTGGGFSYVFSQPSWQAGAVSSYLNSACAAGNANGCTLPSSSSFNSANRAYPDVSAFGGYLPIQLNGQQTVVSGTSVSAPIWAGLIARLNEVSLARTGSPLGFVNALFYQMAAQQPNTFNDIAQGNNVCPQGNSNCVTAVQGGTSTSCQGFTSTPGWDPVTGLGSPNIGNMLAYLTAKLPAMSSSSTGSPSQTNTATTATNNNPASGSTAAQSTADSSTSPAHSPPSVVAANATVASSSSSASASSGGGAHAGWGGSSSSGRNGAAGRVAGLGWWLAVTAVLVLGYAM